MILPPEGEPVVSVDIIRDDEEITESDPAWSPSDDRLLFCRKMPGKPRTTVSQIVVIDLEGTDPETVIFEKASRETSWSAGPTAPDWNPMDP